MLSPNFNFLDLTVCSLQANQFLSAKICEQKQRHYALTTKSHLTIETVESIHPAVTNKAVNIA